MSQKKDASHDFDFLHGRWRIENRRLVKRLAGCTEWETFEATGECKPLPGGLGNYDDFTPVDWLPGFVGMSLRIFSHKTQKWSIYWADTRNQELCDLVVGGFEGGVGIFDARQIFEGKPIIMRYRWSDVDTPSPRWEQLFSEDDGKTWESNWTMQFTRI